jgi:hypothetical protein
MHVDAPAHEVYAIFADYRQGHPAILPRPPFVSLAVEEGGTGAGTTIRVAMRLLGRTRSFRAHVTEPEPGRVLLETNDTGYVTSFRVEPDGDGRGSEVTISTEQTRRSGQTARLERWFMGRILRPVFERELELLAGVAANAVTSGARTRAAPERDGTPEDRPGSGHPAADAPGSTPHGPGAEGSMLADDAPER